MAVAGPEPAPKPPVSPMQERVTRLKTMGFTRGEIKPIIEAEFKQELSDDEFDTLFTEMQLELAKMPEVAQLKLSLGETWARQENLLQDLLGLYQLLVQHFNAYMTGKSQLEDGTPVRMVKAKDLMGVIQMITKLGQENVTSKMNAIRFLPELELPAPQEDHDPKALMSDFVDVDFEDHLDDEDGG